MNGVRRNNAGVTLTELLVVLLIIAILATIAVPVYLNRVEEARVRTAQGEVRELAVAEDMCAATHGFYVPLQVLDDVVQPEQSNSTRDDSIQNEYSHNSGLYLYKVGLPPTAQLGGTQRQLSDSQPGSANYDTDVANLLNKWGGPFVNFNRYFKGMSGNTIINNAADSSDTQIQEDFPLDPWGQPYRIFGPLGILGSGNVFNSTSPSEWNSTMFNLQQTNRSGEQDPFDRFAIVSYGPNHTADLSGTGAVNSGDDIIYMFGFVASESAF